MPLSNSNLIALATGIAVALSSSSGAFAQSAPLSAQESHAPAADRGDARSPDSRGQGTRRHRSLEALSPDAENRRIHARPCASC